MAKQLAYTGPDGVSHPESYWRIDALNINVRAKKAVYHFFGYHSAATAEDGKAALAGSVRRMTIEGEEFTARLTEVIALQKSPHQIGYLVATERGLFPNAIDV